MEVRKNEVVQLKLQKQKAAKAFCICIVHTNPAFREVPIDASLAKGNKGRPYPFEVWTSTSGTSGTSGQTLYRQVILPGLIPAYAGIVEASELLNIRFTMISFDEPSKDKFYIPRDFSFMNPIQYT